MKRIGEFTLDAGRRVLYYRGAAVALGPKPVQLLGLLADNAGSLSAKEDLMDALWPDGFVEEGNLTQYVYLLRGTLRDGGLPDAIETVPRRGYRLTVPVDSVAGVPPKRRAIGSWPKTAALSLGLLLLAAPAVRTTPAYARLSLESQRLYALGRFHWNLRGDGGAAGLNESVRDFSAVVVRDPHNPLGYAGLADAYLGIYDYPCDERGCPHIVALALANARRAVALDPDSAVAHTSLAMVLHALAADDDGATREFRRAIEIDPQYATAHAWYGTMLTLHGDFDEARRQLTIAVALDPVSPATYAWLARGAYYAHRYDDAVSYAREALTLEPRRFETRVVLGLSLAASGRPREGIRAFERLASIGGDPAQVRALIATVLAHSEPGRAKNLLAATPTPRRNADYVPDVAMAWISAGENFRALAYFDTMPVLDAMHRRLLANDPRLDGVRADPRFRAWTLGKDG
ncbi:MAG TPA: winged helix-turn-helix domain-containing protein [Candidatus Acidoferrales bacterium]|nr:winged helix-turn-helix domain-containing protein [Candidatus Acidoferrales bacterium]